MDAYSNTELAATIDEYQIHVAVLNKQIQAVEKELDWLMVKINRISDSGRKVPRQLKTSVASKEKKANSLRKEMNELKMVKARYEKAHQARVRKTAQATVAKDKAKPFQASIIKPIATVSQAKVKQINPALLDRGKKSDIEKAMKKAGLDDWLEILNADGGCAKIQNSLPLLFSSGSANLAREYQPFLKKLAHFLKPYDVKVLVNGYADPDPIHTPKYSSNFELGASRAVSVVHQLVKYGLKPDIFKIGTTGEHHFTAKIPSKQKSFQRRAQVTVVFSG